MSQSSQRRKLTSQSPARPRNVRHDNGRYLGLVNTPQGLRGRLPLLAVLLTLAMLVLVPAVVLAAAPDTPTGLAATSGDGTMKLTWNTVTGATGYEYRYTDGSFGFSLPDSCNCFVSEWLEASTSQNDGDKTISAGTLTVGTTYLFQVRAVNTNDNPDAYSSESNMTTAMQRATPPKVENLAATAGNAEVTLTWDDLANYAIVNYQYRQGDGTTWGDWTDATNRTISDGTVTYKVADLSSGTQYSFQVRGTNWVGDDTKEGPDGDTVTATPSGPPAAPDLRATPGDVSMRLYWANLNDATITKFQYRKGITPENPEVAVVWDPDWEDITGSSATTVDHAVKGLTNGTEYTFEVRAVNDGGDGAAATVNATPTDAARTPSQMLNLQATVTGVSGGSGGTVTFTWDDPEEDFIDKEQYRYDVSSGNPDNWDVDWTDLPGEGGRFLDFTIWEVGLHGSSAILFYELRAVNNDADDSSTDDVNEGAGPATAITVSRSNTPGESTEPPAAPGDLTATPGVEQVTLSWTASTTPSGAAITKYQYRQSSSQDSEGNAVWNPDWTDISGSGPTTTEHTVSSLTDGTTYTFEVRAFHDNKTADDSDPNNGDETEDDLAGAAAQAEAATPGAPNAPTLDSAVPADEQVTLTWTAGATIDGVTVTRFQFRQRASGDATWGAWTDVPNSDSTTTTHIADGLKIGTAYEFQVRAVSDSGNSQPSDTVPATTTIPPKPEKPKGLTATPGADSVTLRWDSPDDLTIDKYRYQQTETASGGIPDFSASPWLLIKDSGSGTIEHEVPDLTVGTLYYFQIQSGSAYKDSDPSDYKSARPLPVRGDWSFEALINPDPLVTGNTEGAVVTFTATFTATTGVSDLTDLSASFTTNALGASGTDLVLSNTDSGKVGFRPISGDDSILVVSHRGTYSTTEDDTNACIADKDHGIIICAFEPTKGSSGNGLFAKTNATPGSYPVSLTFKDSQITLVATASTADHTDFTVATASKADIGEGGQFNLTLNVESGPPDAPSGFSAVGGNSLATLSWDDPDNAGITSYQYRRRTLDKVTLTWDADATATGWEYRHSRDGETSWVPDWTAIPGSDGNPATFNTFTITGVDPADTNVFEVRPAGGDVVTLTQETISGVAFGSWTPIPGSGAPTTSYVKTGLYNTETYVFELRAVTPLPNGDPGEAATSAATSLVAGSPAKPMGFTATPSDTVTEVILSWDEDTSATDGWEYRQTTASAALLAWTQVADTTITGWEYRHSKDGGTTWNPDWGTSITPTLDATKYTAIVAGIDPDDLNLFEVRPTRDGGDQPKVPLDRQPIIGDFTGLGWTPIDGSIDHRVSGLDLVKNTYYFEVRPVTATADGAVVTPTVRQVGSIALTWDDPHDGTITKYQYHYAEVNQNTDARVDSGWKDMGTSDGNTVTYTIPELKSIEVVPGDPAPLENDFVYTIKIRAVNNSGDMGAETSGLESDEVKANPGLPLAAPKNVTASYNPATGAFTIGWDAYNRALFKPDFEVLGTGPRGVSLRVTAVTVLGDSPVIPDSVEIVTDLFGDYTFVVKAREDFGPWVESVTVSETTSPFAEASLTREVDENAPAGSNVGKPVVVAAIGFDVTYSMSGNSAFTIDPATGQITVEDATPSPEKYRVKVIASMSKGEALSDGSIDVTITVTTSGPWLELAKLTPIGSADHRAGNAVAVDGDTGVIVIGAKDAGRVYVYESLHDFSPAILVPIDTTTSQFGLTVAVDGDTVVVGSKAKRVFVFTKPDTGWPDPVPGGASPTTMSETAVLTASDTADSGTTPNDQGFGEAVAISGDTIVVAAGFRDKTGTDNIGGAYVFVKPDDGWAAATESATLQGPTTNTEATLNRATDDFFGRSIAIDGDNVAVGAPGKETAYLFVKPGGWTGAVEPTATLNGKGTVDGDGFGWSIDIDGSTIVVGEHQNNTGPGAAYVFTGSGSSWKQTAELSGLGADLGDEFGYSVAVSGDYIAVARRSQPDNDNAGSVEVFQKSETAATPYVLLASDGGADDRFGQAFVDTQGIWDGRPIAMDGNLLVVGATFGAAYVFTPVTRPSVVSGEVYKLGSAYTDTTVTSRDGDTRVTIPGGAVPTATRYFQQVTRFSGCSGITGRTVHDCIDVRLYDLDGKRILFNEGVRLKDGTEVTLSKPSTDAIRVSNLGGSPRTWRPVLECSNGDDPRECYTIADNSIVVTGITSFSQYAVTTTSDVTPPQRPPVRRPSGRGGGGATAHVPPTFDEGASAIRQIAENSPTGTRIGEPLVARDPLERRVLYTRGGPDAGLFDVASQTGQIYVRRGTVLDYESGRKTFLIEVVGNTGVGGPAKIAVTIIVTNVPELGSVVLSPDTPPEVGAEITAALSDPDSGINGVNWQWQRSSDGRTWNDIPGATSASYMPTETDRGMMLRASVSYNDAAATGINLVGLATAAVPERTPILDRPGSVTLSTVGAPEVGTAITATLIDPDGGVTGATWQWQRSADGVTWTAIDGASAAGYTPTEADIGMMLRANVSYSDAVAAGVSLVSATTGTVAAMPAPDQPGTVTLSPEGTPEIGKAITATVTDPDGEVTGEIWQWQRSADGVTWTDIDGATTERYTPTEADAGMVLRANVSYNDAVATGVNAMGMNTEAVAASPAPGLETPTPTPTPPSPLVRPDTPTPPPTPVVPPQTPTPTQTMLPTPPPTDVPPTPTAITSEVTPTEAPTTPVTPEEEGGFPAWLIIVIIIGAVIIIAGIIIIVRSRMQQ